MEKICENCKRIGPGNSFRFLRFCGFYMVDVKPTDDATNCEEYYDGEETQEVQKEE